MTEKLQWILEVDGDRGVAEIRKADAAIDGLGKTGDKTSGAMQSLFSVAQALAGAYGLKMLATSAVQTGIAFEQAAFSMQKTFGAQAERMISLARQIADQAGQFYRWDEVAYAFTKTADSMQRYGITGERYVNMVSLAADIGAAKNLELKESIDRIESAMRGESEASEYLGVTLNDTYMKNVAFNGALADQWEKLSDQAKAFYRYNELLNQTGKYVGSANEATNTLSGAWKKLTNQLAQEFEPLVKGINFELKNLVQLASESMSIVNAGPTVHRFKIDPKTGAAAPAEDNAAKPAAGALPELPSDIPKFAPGGGDEAGAEKQRREDLERFKLAWESQLSAHDAALQILQAQNEQAAEQELQMMQYRETNEGEGLRRRLETLTGHHDAALALIQWRTEEEVRLEQEKANQITFLDKYMSATQKQQAYGMLQNWQFAFQELGKSSQTAFGVFKAFAIAETVIKTYEAAQGAYASLAGIPIVGPALGAAAAAAAIAAGMARVAAISSQQPGSTGGVSGGGGGAVGTYSASPTTGLPDYGYGAPEKTGTLTINFQGDFIGDETYIENLVEKISDAVETRDVRLVATNSRYAEALS